MAYSGNHSGNWGEGVRFGLSWLTFLKCVLYWEEGEGGGRGRVSFTYFTFSSGLDTGFYFLSQ